MEVERIKVVKDWPKPKLVCNIQVFLAFVNFYWRFIQGFSKIAALLTLMLKKTGSPNKPATSRNNGSRSAPSGNNNNKLASRRNINNDEVDGFVDEEHAKKSGKLKGQKSAKSWKLSKLGKSRSEKSKKPSKCENSPNFDATKAGLSFLTPDARTIFNHLRLAFIKALILWYFNSKCHI